LRKRKPFKGLFYPILAVSAFAIIIILLVLLPNIYPTEDWATMQTSFIALMPWLVMLGTGLMVFSYVVRDKPRNLYAFTVPLTGFIGVGNAMILSTMYKHGLLIDEVLAIHSTITLTDLQILCILAWVVVGLVVGILNDR